MEEEKKDDEEEKKSEVMEQDELNDAENKEGETGGDTGGAKDVAEVEVQLATKDTVANPDNVTKARSQPATNVPASKNLSNYAYSSAAGNNASGNKEKAKNSKKA